MCVQRRSGDAGEESSCSRPRKLEAVPRYNVYRYLGEAQDGKVRVEVVRAGWCMAAKGFVVFFYKGKGRWFGVKEQGGSG